MECSVARTLHQNGVAERRNRPLIEAARTMLADSKLPTTFWAEAVSTACYVQNRVLVVKPHNKTPYELFRGFKPALSFMRPFGCHVTILNTLDNLGKFDGKSNEGFFVGYSLSSKAFRVYNTRTRRVEENLHIRFLENKPMIEGNGPKWLFDIDSLTQSMNYVPIAAGTITNESTGTQGELNAGTSTQKEEISQDCIVMPIWKDASYFDSPSKDVGNDEPKSTTDDQKQVEDGPDNESDEKDKSDDDSSPKEVNTVGQHVNTASPEVNTGRFKLNIVDPSVNTASSYAPDSPKDMFNIGASHTLEATHVEFLSDEDKPKVDLGNILNSYTVLTTLNTRIHKDHPIKNVIGDVKSSIQTRKMTKPTFEQGFLSAVYEQKTHDTLNTCLYDCFLSQIEPTSIAKALSNSSWVEAMQEELLQFKLQQVWILVDLPIRNSAIGTKWVFRNKKGERGIVIRNKARVHSYMEPLRKRFMLLNQHDLKILTIQTKFTRWSRHFMGCIKLQEHGTFAGFEKLIKDKFQVIYGRTYFHSRDTIDLEKPLVKDGDDDDVDVHLYRSMIGSLVYLTSSRPDIMFVVCACARFQVTLKISHLLVVKKIFRYLKGKPTLGLWYSKDSPFELVAYTDSDYAGATQDRKSTTGGCPFLGNRLISWQCKKQTVVATSTTEAEYVAAASCCGQVGDEAVHKELGDRMERAATTASSLEAEQDSDAQTSTNEDGVRGITTTIDRKVKVFVSEASIRRHLKLEDSEGLKTLPTIEIFEQLTLMGYVITFDSLTFQKGHFLPQWKFFIHTILHCLSPKKTVWELFSSNIATAIICLATNRTFNFSNLIFEATVKNLDSRSKFLMYPRFIQIFLNKRKRMLLPHKRTFPTPTLTQKLFSNMKRASKGYSGVDIPLFTTMLIAPESSPSRITSSPSLSPQTHPSTSQPPSTPPYNQTTPVTVKSRNLDSTRVLDLEKSKECSSKGDCCFEEEGLEVGKEKDFKNYRFEETKEAIDVNVEVTLVDETQEKQDEDLMFDTGVLDSDEMPVEAKIDEKDEQSTKLDDNTAGEAVTTAGEAVTTAGVEGSAAPITIEEITLAHTLIQIKAAKPKVITTAATTTTTTRPKVRGVVVQEPSEFRTSQESHSTTIKDKRKAIMVEPEVPLKRKDQVALDEQLARDVQA
ncbi:putative ribonuclease H-like domain-containing protein [Tanacetum coccineum]